MNFRRLLPEIRWQPRLSPVPGTYPLRLFYANISRNFFNLGATTNEQYPSPGFLTKYS